MQADKVVKMTKKFSCISTNDWVVWRGKKGKINTMGIKLSQLANKEMNRKEFLQHAGIGLALVAGGGMVAKALGVGLAGNNSQSNALQTSAKSLSYGGSAYGK